MVVKYAQTDIANEFIRRVKKHIGLETWPPGTVCQNTSIDLSSYVKYNSTYSIIDEKTVLSLLTGCPRKRENKSPRK